MELMNSFRRASAYQVLVLLAALWAGHAHAALLLYDFSATKEFCTPAYAFSCQGNEITGSFAIDSSELDVQGDGQVTPLFMGAALVDSGGMTYATWYAKDTFSPPPGSLDFTNFELTTSSVLSVFNALVPPESASFHLGGSSGRSGHWEERQGVPYYSPILVTVYYGSRTVTLLSQPPVIPLPAALPLFLSALVGLGAISRWRR